MYISKLLFNIIIIDDLGSLNQTSRVINVDHYHFLDRYLHCFILVIKYFWVKNRVINRLKCHLLIGF